MEYKLRQVKKQKKQGVKAKKALGFTRVVIRGRKRWVKTKPAAEAGQ